MATKADCVKAAMKAGLDKDAALRVVDDLLLDRRKAHELQAQGQAADAEAALAGVWKNRMTEEEIQSALARKQAALNVMTRANLDARIKEDPKRTFDGLFGVFNDSLPDGWGLLLLDRALRKRGGIAAFLPALAKACHGRHARRGRSGITEKDLLAAAATVNIEAKAVREIIQQVDAALEKVKR
jgi:hypothetical protein